MNNKNLSSILLFLSFQLSAMEQPEQEFSKLQLLPSDLKLKVLKDVIGRSATAKQAIKSTRIFIFNDPKLCLEMDKTKLACIIQLLAHGWFWCNVGYVTLNHLLPNKPQSKAGQHILEEVKKPTLHELEQRHPLRKTAQEYFNKFYECTRHQKIPEDILEGLELNYYHQCGSTHYTPLLFAALSGNLCAIQQFIEAGCNLEKTDLDGNTALHIVIEKQSPYVQQLAKMLIDAEANLDARNKKGETPLIIASKSNPVSDELCQLLIAAGADQSVRDNNGNTAWEHKTFEPHYLRWWAESLKHLDAHDF